MDTGDILTKYRDYEQIMIRLAKERDWEFEFAGETVPTPSVFNHAIYAPALFVAAGAELEAREITCDLAYDLGGEANSLFGAKVSFREAGNTIVTQIMRIASTSTIIESLPRHGRMIQLDPLQYVLGEEYAHFVGQGKDAG